MPSFSQTRWTCCKRWSLEWTAPTGTQPCTVFSCKEYCGSTALGISVGMNRQIDWQPQQISHLCSLAWQRCSEAWGTFWTWTSQSITALIAWRKEEWWKEAADIPPSKVENDLCSTRQILALFRGQPWWDSWETGWSVYEPFWVLQCHLELKLKQRKRERASLHLLPLHLSLYLPCSSEVKSVQAVNVCGTSVSEPASRAAVRLSAGAAGCHGFCWQGRKH